MGKKIEVELTEEQLRYLLEVVEEQRLALNRNTGAKKQKEFLEFIKQLRNKLDETKKEQSAATAR